MKSNGKQKALYLALCILVAVVVWVFVDNYGPDGSGPVIYAKYYRDVPITYTGETVLTERGLMLEEGTDTTVVRSISWKLMCSVARVTPLMFSHPSGMGMA